MQIQKQHITDQFYEYYIYDFPIIVKEISENRFDVNYSKLVGLLYEEKCRRCNKVINENTLRSSFINYINTEKFIFCVNNYLKTKNINIILNNNEKITSVPDLCEKTNGLFYQEKNVANEVKGTYGPHDFIDYILIDFKPEIIFEYINKLKHDNDVLKTRVGNYLNIIFGE